MAAVTLLPLLCADSTGHGCVEFQLQFGPQMWCSGFQKQLRKLLSTLLYLKYTQSSGVVVSGEVGILKKNIKILHV